MNFLTSGCLSQANTRSEVEDSGIVLSRLEKTHFRICLLCSSINEEGVFTLLSIKVVLTKIRTSKPAECAKKNKKITLEKTWHLL